MLSLRFQSINIVNQLGSDCGNGTDVYVSMSGLTTVSYTHLPLPTTPYV